MYWYKPLYIRSFFILNITLLISGLYACKPDIKDNRKKFFDVAAYFKGEAKRLTKLSPPVTKTAKHNTDTQTKLVTIKNWPGELDMFIASDINKPSWRDSYTVTTSGDITIYKAKFPELKTREVMIKKACGKVNYVLILNYSENLLYTNTEKLSYFPDSLYEVVKRQRVRLIGENRYKIQGFFKR
jgi:hypothetical protein